MSSDGWIADMPVFALIPTDVCNRLLDPYFLSEMQSVLYFMQKLLDEAKKTSV